MSNSTLCTTGGVSASLSPTGSTAAISFSLFCVSASLTLLPFIAYRLYLHRRHRQSLIYRLCMSTLIVLLLLGIIDMKLLDWTIIPPCNIMDTYMLYPFTYVFAYGSECLLVSIGCIRAVGMHQGNRLVKYAVITATTLTCLTLTTSCFLGFVYLAIALVRPLASQRTDSDRTIVAVLTFFGSAASFIHFIMQVTLTALFVHALLVGFNVKKESLKKLIWSPEMFRFTATTLLALGYFLMCVMSSVLSTSNDASDSFTYAWLTRVNSYYNLLWTVFVLDTMVYTNYESTRYMIENFSMSTTQSSTVPSTHVKSYHQTAATSSDPLNKT